MCKLHRHPKIHNSYVESRLALPLFIFRVFPDEDFRDLQFPFSLIVNEIKELFEKIGEKPEKRRRERVPFFIL